MWDRPGTMDGWVGHEYASLNASLVTTKKSLATLLTEAEPSCTTRAGDPWPIERGALQRLEAACRPGDADSLRLPISLHFHTELEVASYRTASAAWRGLPRAESCGPAFPFPE